MEKRLEIIAKIKRRMEREKAKFFFLTTGDPHLSEYPCERWKILERVTGFSGSNGFLVLSDFGDFLWTDSRYLLQAEKELQGTSISIKQMVTGEEPLEWLASFDRFSYGVVFDGDFFSQSFTDKLYPIVRQEDGCFFTDFRLDKYVDMPDLPNTPVFLHPEEYCGEFFSEKKERIFASISSEVTHLFLSSLDDIAWTFNIRSSDSSYTPYVISYAILARNGTSILFADESRFDEGVKKYLKENKVRICRYEKVKGYVKKFSCRSDVKFSIDPSRLNHNLFHCFAPYYHHCSEPSPVPLLKSVKNATESRCVRNAMVKDGVALVEAISEIKTRIEEHVRTTEIDVSRILAKHRKMQENYFSDSFETISAYGPNGAVVHYSPKEEDCAEVGTDSLLLIDSGGNYYDGTTDITRVFAFGVPTAEQKRDYTAVLKGHIALATARFLKGTRGGELDVLAHQHLWREGLDYGHGTGHGVGFFLSVHEGPQKISRTGNTSAVLQEGMLLSDEPGVYRAGVHGIRIENMVQVVADGRSEFGEFLRFETLTLFPYEPRLIDKTMLDEKEIAWVNNYHEKVRTEILPILFSKKAKDWLKEVTEKL